MRVIFLTPFDPLTYQRPFFVRRALGASRFYLKYYEGATKETPYWINYLCGTPLKKLRLLGIYTRLKIAKLILSRKANAVIVVNPRWLAKIVESCRIVHQNKVIIDCMDVSLNSKMELPPIEVQAMSRADGVIFWSKTLMKIISQKYRLKRSTYVPMGADLSLLDFNKVDPKKFRHTHDLNSKFLVVYSGGIWMMKGREAQGIFDLIKAYSLVVRRTPNIAFVFNGFYPDEKISQMVRDLNLGNHVLFLGPFRYGSERHLGALAAADVLVLPATRYPPIYYAERMKMFDYMAAGKAIVAVRTPGAEGVLDEKACIYTEVGDIESIADGMIRALGDKNLREELGNRAREILKSNYTWDALAPKYAKFVWNICQNEDSLRALRATQSLRLDHREPQ